jgi:hypothetical protein
MKTFKKFDEKFGEECEKIVLEILNKNKYFDDGILVRHPLKFNIYDFYGYENWYELKSRKCSYNSYPTTLIAKDKAVKNGMVFLFYFVPSGTERCDVDDKSLYYIIYEPEIFKNFECSIFKRNKREDYNDKEKEYYYIPIQNLIKIEYN